MNFTHEYIPLYVIPGNGFKYGCAFLNDKETIIFDLPT